MNINKINLNNLYTNSFKGEKKEPNEKEAKKSFGELLSEINFEPKKSQMSLLDAIKLREAEEKSKEFSTDYTLYTDA